MAEGFDVAADEAGIVAHLRLTPRGLRRLRLIGTRSSRISSRNRL